ncbi:four-carbon acid sugar kinase family protein [Cyanobium sp. CH-040]|uniref:four-carbon acid sugar kinase family protein n=1 Tax=Cyanobium sp. CH-040 TaxID=2823708 RepID=UPI0020CE2E79|nr:four-carbon acid sugar kinase family protein [Cyanobium sp. CH-040]MCP9926631.1 four-carbon acid sugar kinase family protein [Cyanobium sp. CH-040]
MAAVPLKIVVFDDDPTGSQTLHSCPLLLRWDAASLRAALAHPSPFLFLLANTRALDPPAAAARVREICRALGPALAEARAAGLVERWLLVSRGDSTLRSHFPLELEAIAAELAGPEGFDATLLVPAFLPGGRTTRDGVHRLHGEPVHTTAFARDRLLGYRSSYLPAWVEEKSGGRIPAAAVERIGLAELDAAAAELAEGGAGRDGDGGAGWRALCARLAALEDNRCVAVDAERPQQLAALGAAVRELTAPVGAPWRGRPRRFLFQSAASLLNALAPIGAQPLDPPALAGLRRRDPDGAPLPGLVLVGSHVPLADAQLAALLAEPGCAGIEVEVAKLARVLEGPVPDALLASLERGWLQRLEAQLAAGRTPVLFTSRGEIHCRSAGERRRLGLELAGLMARLAAALAPRLGYLISKGGITTHTLLAEGLGAAWVELQGQILPGLSLVRLPGDGVTGTPELAALPVVTFPGNLGEPDTLRRAWELMEFRAGSAPAAGSASPRRPAPPPGG